MTTISPGAASMTPSSVKKRTQPSLRHDQHLAVGIVEDALAHRAIGGVKVHGHAELRRDIAVAAERDHALDEVGGPLRDRHRAPAQLRRRRVDIVERRAADETVVHARIGAMHHRGLDAVGPGAAVFRARHGERRAGNQLGVEPVRRPLRRIASDRQGAGHRLGLEIVAETRVIMQQIGAVPGPVFGSADFGIGLGRIHRRNSRKSAYPIPRNWSLPQLSAFELRRASASPALQTAGTGRDCPSPSAPVIPRRRSAAGGYGLRNSRPFGRAPE